jgi:hypothetical protein
MNIVGLLLTGAIALCPMPAFAATVVLASNIDFRSAPFTFGVTPTDRYTLSFNSREQFDPSPVLVSTTGTAAVTTFFGAPSVFSIDPPVTFGPNTFPGFNTVPVATRAPFTLTASDLGLRYGSNGAFFYGYARFSGGLLDRVAFESVANTPILAGAVASAVPEPGTWLTMMIGFGVIGGAVRRRRRAVTALA